MDSLVTISVPTYRRPSLLLHALHSCFLQDYRPIEVDVEHALGRRLTALRILLSRYYPYREGALRPAYALGLFALPRAVHNIRTHGAWKSPLGPAKGPSATWGGNSRPDAVVKP